MKKNVGNIKETDLLDSESPASFYSRLVANAFVIYQKDPAKYVEAGIVTNDEKNVAAQSIRLSEDETNQDENYTEGGENATVGVGICTEDGGENCTEEGEEYSTRERVISMEGENDRTEDLHDLIEDDEGNHTKGVGGDFAEDVGQNLVEVPCGEDETGSGEYDIRCGGESTEFDEMNTECEGHEALDHIDAVKDLGKPGSHTLVEGGQHVLTGVGEQLDLVEVSNRGGEANSVFGEHSTGCEENITKHGEDNTVNGEDGARTGENASFGGENGLEEQNLCLIASDSKNKEVRQDSVCSSLLSTEAQDEPLNSRLVDHSLREDLDTVVTDALNTLPNNLSLNSFVGDLSVNSADLLSTMPAIADLSSMNSVSPKQDNSKVVNDLNRTKVVHSEAISIHSSVSEASDKVSFNSISALGDRAGTFSSPNSSSFSFISSTVRRSSRIATRAKKSVVDDEVLALIEPPSASVQRREKREARDLAEFERKRKRENLEHLKIMEDLEDQKKKDQERIAADKEEFNKVKEMGRFLRRNLSSELIENIIDNNLQYFENISTGKEECWRFLAFKNGSAQNGHILRNSMIADPFSDEQQDKIFDKFKSYWKPVGMDRFLDVVLLPEVFTRIYQVFFNLPMAEARKNLRNVGNLNDSSDNNSDL